MTISDECLNSVLLQGSQGLDHLVWREQWEQRGMEEVARSKHKHHCLPAFMGKKTGLKSHCRKSAISYVSITPRIPQILNIALKNWSFSFFHTTMKWLLDVMFLSKKCNNHSGQQTIFVNGTGQGFTRITVSALYTIQWKRLFLSKLEKSRLNFTKNCHGNAATDR